MPGSPEWAGFSTDQVARGLEVYRASYCGTCHTSSAAHTSGTFGPSHDGLLTTARTRLSGPAYRGNARTVADYLRESILAPEAFVAPAYAGSRYRMPAYTELSRRDLEALVAFLAQP